MLETSEPLLVRLPASTTEPLAVDITLTVNEFTPAGLPQWAFVTTAASPNPDVVSFTAGSWDPAGYVGHTIRALSPTFGARAGADVPLTAGAYSVYVTFSADGDAPVRLTHRLILF